MGGRDGNGKVNIDALAPRGKLASASHGAL